MSRSFDTHFTCSSCSLRRLHCLPRRGIGSQTLMLTLKARMQEMALASASTHMSLHLSGWRMRAMPSDDSKCSLKEVTYMACSQR